MQQALNDTSSKAEEEEQSQMLIRYSHNGFSNSSNQRDQNSIDLDQMLKANKGQIKKVSAQKQNLSIIINKLQHNLQKQISNLSLIPDSNQNQVKGKSFQNQVKDKSSSSVLFSIIYQNYFQQFKDQIYAILQEKDAQIKFYKQKQQINNKLQSRINNIDISELEKKIIQQQKIILQQQKTINEKKQKISEYQKLIFKFRSNGARQNEENNNYYQKYLDYKIKYKASCDTLAQLKKKVNSLST